jgi:hypothetical protein
MTALFKTVNSDATRLLRALEQTLSHEKGRMRVNAFVWLA